MIVYRFGANLYYANAAGLADDLLDLAASDPPPARIILTAGAIADVDFTGSAQLGEVRQELAERGVTLELCRLQDAVRRQLRLDGLLDAIGADHIYDQIEEAVAGHTTP